MSLHTLIALFIVAMFVLLILFFLGIASVLVKRIYTDLGLAHKYKHLEQLTCQLQKANPEIFLPAPVGPQWKLVYREKGDRKDTELIVAGKSEGEALEQAIKRNIPVRSIRSFTKL